MIVRLLIRSHNSSDEPDLFLGYSVFKCIFCTSITRVLRFHISPDRKMSLFELSASDYYYYYDYNI